MKRNDTFTSYRDLLKDKRFLRWQLLPDETLNSYWEEFFKLNPELEKELQRAVIYLRKEGLNKSNFNKNERIELFDRIQGSISRKKKRRNRQLMWFASSVAAISLLVIGSILFFPSQKPIALHDKELIIGEMLQNENIQFITNEETISFGKDVEVKMNEEGTVEISGTDSDVTSIPVNRGKMNSLIVPYGKRSTLTLVDGTKVWLNSGSVLEFPTQFSGEKREIKLVSGEIYIEVAHNNDQPFSVHTPDFNVRVYGTKFNLSRYDGVSHSVVLVEGSVSVQSAAKEIRLKPNEQLLISGAETSEIQTVDVSQYISWKDGYMQLNKTPMTEILERIGRYYNLSFNYEQDMHLQKRTCSGKIYLSENLDNVMTTIALLSGTQYKKVNNRIYITHETE